MNRTRVHSRRSFRASLIAGAIAALGLGSSTLACEPADFDMSGHIGLEDLAGYLTAFLAGDKAADIDADGKVTIGDLFEFIGSWVPRYIESSQVKPIEPAESTAKDQLTEQRVDITRRI